MNFFLRTLILLLVTASAAVADPITFNFRSSGACALPDGTATVIHHNTEYSSPGAGFTSGVNMQHTNWCDAVSDVRLAGHIRNNTSFSEQVTFRVDLPAAGEYEICAAFGDRYWVNESTNILSVKIRDDLAEVYAVTVDPSGKSANQWYDIAGNLHAAADWASSQTCVTREFATTIFNLDLCTGSTVECQGISHLSITPLDSPGPTPTPTATATPVPPTPTPTATATATPMPPGVPEHCGDGRQPACSGRADNDLDGYNADETLGLSGTSYADCDDADKDIYPGVYVPHSGGQWKKCQNDGTYSTPSSADFCPSECGSCRYIDAATGSDSNNGLTEATAWATYLNFVSYYNVGDRPTGYEAPAPGRCYIFKAGTYDDRYAYDTSTKAFYWVNVHGTSDDPIRVQAYPGHEVTFNPGCNISTRCSSVDLLVSSYIHFFGTRHTGTYSFNVNVAESEHITFEQLRVYDGDGNVDNNPSGIAIVGPSDDITVKYSRIWDNYARINPGGGGGNNNGQIQIFGSNTVSNLKLLFNTVFTSSVVTGVNAIKWKHGNDNGSAIIRGNHIYNGDRSAISMTANNIAATHNLIDGGGGGFECENNGGNSWCQDLEFSRNTVLNTTFFSKTRFGVLTGSYGKITMANNFYRTNKNWNASAGSEDGVYAWDLFDENDSIRLNVEANGYHDSRDNCFWNAYSGNPFLAKWFSSGSGGGAVYSNFATWQGLSFSPDVGSTFSSISIDSNSNPSNPDCGWYRIAPGVAPTPTPTPEPTATPTPTRTPTPEPTATPTPTATATSSGTVTPAPAGIGYPIGRATRFDRFNR